MTHEGHDENATIAPALLTTRQAAQLANIGERTLWRWSREIDQQGMSKAPPPIKLHGTLIRYRRDDILRWIAEGCGPWDAGDAPPEAGVWQPPRNEK